MGACDNPSCSAEGTKRCARCGQATYCGVECQRVGYGAHRRVCKKSVKHGMKMVVLMAKSGGAMNPWSYLVRGGMVNVEAFADMLDNDLGDVVVYAELRRGTNEVLKIDMSLKFKDTVKDNSDSNIIHCPIVNFGDVWDRLYGDTEPNHLDHTIPAIPELMAECAALLRLMGRPVETSAETIPVIMTSMKSALCVINKRAKNIPETEEDMERCLADI